MFKKILIPSIFSVLILFGCSESSDETKNKLSANEQLKYVEENYSLKDGYSLDNASLIDFTPNKEKEILVISNNEENTKIEILSFDEKNEKWNSIYLDTSHNNFEGLENLNLIKVLKTDSQDHIVLGYEGGFYNTLNFKVLGYDSSKDDIVIVFDKMLNEHTDAFVLFENNDDHSPSISIENDESILEYFKWDDDSSKYEEIEK